MDLQKTFHTKNQKLFTAKLHDYDFHIYYTKCFVDNCEDFDKD